MTPQHLHQHEVEVGHVQQSNTTLMRMMMTLIEHPYNVCHGSFGT